MNIVLFKNLRTTNTNKYKNILNNSSKTSKCSADNDELYDFKVLNEKENYE